MGLIAREIESRGIPTVTVSLSREMTERFRPPRAIFFDFPLGRPLGRPGDVAMQRQALFEALETLQTAQKPGTIRTGSLRFSGEVCEVCALPDQE